MASPSSHLHTFLSDEGTLVQVPIQPYIKRSKRKKKDDTTGLAQGQWNEAETPQREILLRPGRKTLIRNSGPSFRDNAATKEICKQKKIANVRNLLGKSKTFTKRDSTVLQLIQQPKFVSHKVGRDIPADKAAKAKEEGLRKVAGLQYRKAHEQLYKQAGKGKERGKRNKFA